MTKDPRVRKLEKGVGTMGKPGISLIIPAYNEEKYIGKTLESVMKAEGVYSGDAPVEVIVVDNCCTDNTRRIALSYGATVVFEEKRRIASVRNTGARAAEGEIVGFLDADTMITPNMLNSIDETMSSGRYIGGGTDIKIERESAGIFFTYCLTKYPAMMLFGFMGGLIFTEKKTFEEMGGFDESLYCAEDAKFAIALKAHGRKARKRFRILTKDYVITSARTFDKFGDWYYFKNLPRLIFRTKNAFKDKDFADKYWYKVDR